MLLDEKEIANEFVGYYKQLLGTFVERTPLDLDVIRDGPILSMINGRNLLKIFRWMKCAWLCLILIMTKRRLRWFQIIFFQKNMAHYICGHLRSRARILLYRKTAQTMESCYHCINP